MFAVTKQSGQCFGFPDVCKTPAPPAAPIPIPYPNIAMPMLGKIRNQLATKMPTMTQAQKKVAAA